MLEAAERERETEEKERGIYLWLDYIDWISEVNLSGLEKLGQRPRGREGRI